MRRMKMKHDRMFAWGLVIGTLGGGLVMWLCASCIPDLSGTLHPDPAPSSGPCAGNVNELAVPCFSQTAGDPGWCCPPEYTCGWAQLECIQPDPPVFQKKRYSVTFEEAGAPVDGAAK